MGPGFSSKVADDDGDREGGDDDDDQDFANDDDEEEEEDAKTKSRIKTFCKIGCDIKVKLTQGCFKFANSFQCSGSDGDCPGAMTIVMIMIMIMTMMMKIMIILTFLINYHQHYLHHK